jgi:sulfur-carrier protein adenylyltransferase/sulfurtransferase
VSGDTAKRELPAEKVTRVERHLSEAGLSPRWLREDDLQRQYPDSDVVAGWRIALDDDHEVDVLLGPDYPYRRAQIGIAPLRQDIPRSRVFVNSTLCLLKGNEGHSLNDDERVLDDLLSRTRALLEGEGEDYAAGNAEEIVDYWKGSRSSKSIVSICEVTAAARELFYSNDLPFALVGDTREDVERWVRQYSDSTNPTVRQSVLLSGNIEFPVTMSSGRALYEWFQEKHPDQTTLVESLAAGDPISAPLLIGITDAAGGVALLGAWVRRPEKQKVGQPKGLGTPGFRKGKAPGHVAAPYFFSPESAIENVRVDRADAAWLVDRGGDGSTSAIRSGRIVLVGCGSLGSTIARLLVKAGVSNLTLIDPDLLTWGNTARHELGGRYVGRSKAKALAETIRRDFPNITIRAQFEHWQVTYERDPRALLDADIVVSTTGEPADEIQLSDAAIATANFPSLLFAWLEPFAAAARVLTLNEGDGCLRCGCDEFGVFRDSITDWNGPTHRFEPGCSTSWQPYSEIEALPAKAFVARVILDLLAAKPERSRLWSWLGPEHIRTEHGGTLRKEWVEVHGEPPTSGGIYEDEWTTCPACAEPAA